MTRIGLFDNGQQYQIVVVGGVDVWVLQGKAAMTKHNIRGCAPNLEQPMVVLQKRMKGTCRIFILF